MDIATIAQIASAVGTLAYLVVFGILYYLLVGLYREVLDETREGHLAQERPQILVEADYTRMPNVDLVIRNISQSPAKNLSFEFSSHVEDSEGFVLTDLPYFKRGIGFLAPNSEIRAYRDTLDSVVAMLKERRASRTASPSPPATTTSTGGHTPTDGPSTPSSTKTTTTSATPT